MRKASGGNVLAGFAGPPLPSIPRSADTDDRRIVPEDHPMDSKQQTLVPGITGTPGNDSADLWTTLEPPRARDDPAADLIIASLRTATVAGDLEPLRALALDGDGTRRLESARAALALARRLLAADTEDAIDDTTDTAHAWLWLAAHQGSVTATLLLVDALVERAKVVQRDAAPEDAAAGKRIQALHALACNWFDQLSIWLSEPEIEELPQVIAVDLREPSLCKGPTPTPPNLRQTHNCTPVNSARIYSDSGT
jgi:hypothetical protein